MAESRHDIVILVRLGEITLKGLNRGVFEHRLIANIRRRIKEAGRFSIRQMNSRLWITPLEQDSDLESAMKAITNVFGVVSVSPAWRFSGTLPDLEQMAIEMMKANIKKDRTVSFKVKTRRGDKSFALTSPEISSRIGSVLMKTFPEQLRVDVHNPEIILSVEVRDQFYLYTRTIKGRRGLPVGTGGRGLLLLSGGIDSPVAGYLMASRGMEIEAVYFHAFPYTSDRAKDKVLELASLMAPYTGRIKVHVVHFTEAQISLRDHCPADMLTVLTRRMMMRIAEKIAEERQCKVLITGESLGQVASQTLEALCVTDAVVKRPVFRPLIGWDKQDTVDLAKEIGTYECSIKPYEDCCTVFVAPHPVTHPSLDHTRFLEKDLDIDGLVRQSLEDIEVIDR